jgi:hypothetical protein
MDQIKLNQKASNILRHEPSDLNSSEWKALKRSIKDFLSKLYGIPESDDSNALKKELETLLNKL